MHLITSRQGTPHVTVEQAAAQNRALAGGSSGVFYKTLTEPELVSNTQISMKAMTGMIQGRVFTVGNYDTDVVTIAAGTQGLKRNDLICVKITVDASEGTQSASWVVLKGTASTNPTDPAVNVQDLDNGATETYMAVARVVLNGISIESVKMIADNLNQTTQTIEIWSNPKETASFPTQTITSFKNGVTVADLKSFDEFRVDCRLWSDFAHNISGYLRSDNPAMISSAVVNTNSPTTFVIGRTFRLADNGIVCSTGFYRSTANISKIEQNTYAAIPVRIIGFKYGD